MQIQICHSGNLRDLVRHHPSYADFKHVAVPRAIHRRWNRSENSDVSHDVQAVFIGKTGYGKSSTVNALFNQHILGTSAVEACTRDAQCLEFKIRDGNYLGFTDLPGIGESRARDAEYLPLYAEIIKTADAVVYMMRADTRDYAIDENAYRTLFPHVRHRRNLIIGLNFCDKVEPISRKSTIPTRVQRTHIAQKMALVQEQFDPGGGVVPFSASSGWNIGVLADQISEVMLRSLGP